MRKTIILGVLFTMATSSKAADMKNELKRISDKTTDSIYVVLFYEPPSDAEENGDEIYSDFSYHLGEGFKKIEKWRLIEVNPKSDPEIYRELNPKNKWLFQIWYKGSVVMKSQGVATGLEIKKILKKNALDKM